MKKEELKLNRIEARFILNLLLSESNILSFPTLLKPTTQIQDIRTPSQTNINNVKDIEEYTKKIRNLLNKVNKVDKSFYPKP